MPKLTIPPASSGMNLSASPPAAGEDAELQQFIAAHNLRTDLDRAIAISKEVFPPGSQVVLRLQYSPEEDGGSGLVVDVRARLSVPEAARCHQLLMERWTRELPLRAQSLIGATFTIS